MADDAELARLDAFIAKNDAADTPNARWRAAHALFEKAGIVEDLHGREAALPLLEEVARRMQGATEAGPRGLLLIALHGIWFIHDDADRKQQARAVAEVIVAEHFEDPPEDAIDVVVDSALGFVRFLEEAGEDDRAIELLQRIVDRYGRSDIPNHVLYRSAANGGIANLLAYHGQVQEGVQLYDAVIDELHRYGQLELEAEIVLASALKRQAAYLYKLGRDADGDRRCRELLSRFTRHPDADIARHKNEARQMLEQPRPSRRRTFQLRRPKEYE